MMVKSCDDHCYILCNRRVCFNPISFCCWLSYHCVNMIIGSGIEREKGIDHRFLFVFPSRNERRVFLSLFFSFFLNQTAACLELNARVLKTTTKSNDRWNGSYLSGEGMRCWWEDEFSSFEWSRGRTGRRSGILGTFERWIHCWNE